MAAFGFLIWGGAGTDWSSFQFADCYDSPIWRIYATVGLSRFLPSWLSDSSCLDYELALPAASIPLLLDILELLLALRLSSRAWWCYYMATCWKCCCWCWRKARCSGVIICCCCIMWWFYCWPLYKAFKFIPPWDIWPTLPVRLLDSLLRPFWAFDYCGRPPKDALSTLFWFWWSRICDNCSSFSLFILIFLTFPT